ncbi:FAD binding domain-containing protein [Fusarium tricinctum]|uniref:FAD binding domain-containing protein n=1 Tax=Fusarium tricinctum TaxID=61284 RepID=A0A8K0RSD7_9HYPO|nr:FAD binding domain-containing protein [Fusarium tricinctum]
MTVPSESTTDVVIIGAGPSGLMAALWMARCGVKARIIDARATKVFRGHADGMQTGTLDIFDSFDIVEDLYKNAAPAVEMTIWAGTKDIPVKRVARFPKWYPELGHYRLVHTSQGNTERALLDGMKAFNGLEVERGVIATSLDIDESSVHDVQAHAIKLTVQHLTDDELAVSSANETIPQPGDFNYNPADEPYLKRKVTGKEGSTEVIRAKFVIGADGSRSWTRSALGFDFLGDDESRDESFGGILDCVATSNFPDVHIQSVVSKNGRGAGFVPREDGLLRIAAPVASRADATPEAIIQSLREILHPYDINVSRIDWCGVFGTRQRISSSASKHSRVFLVGDALHVHSPRAGIGMNFTYNLGWKIAHVVKGISPLSILKTYDEERGLTTKQLIAFDKALSKEAQLAANFSVEGTRQGLQDNLPFSSTTAIEYEAGLLVAKEGGSIISKQHLAPGIIVGRRLPSHIVEKHANGEAVDFGKSFPSDGRYRIVIFAGNISQPEQLRRVERFSQLLELPDAFLQRLDGHAISPRDVFDLLVLHSASRDDVEIADLPPFLFKNADPWRQVFVDNNQIRTWTLSEAYEKYGVSRETGCIVLVRPDRHVMYIGELEDGAEMVKLMSSVLV